MKVRYISRGACSSTYDLWSIKPVLIRGNWKSPTCPEAPKKMAPPMDTVDGHVASSITKKLPGPGECLEVSNG